MQISVTRHVRDARTAESLCNVAIPLLEEPTWRCLRLSLCKSAFRRGEQHADIRNNCSVKGLAPFLKPGHISEEPSAAGHFEARKKGYPSDYVLVSGLRERNLCSRR